MYKVVIIDDEPIVKIALKSIINWEENGFTIAGTASDGIEALELVQATQPDIVITDLKMPRMDGIALIQELNHANFPGEILVISNYDDFESVRAALVQGASNYILKVNIEAEPFLDALNELSEKLSQKKTQHNQNFAVPEAENKRAFFSNLKNYLETDGFDSLDVSSPSCESMFPFSFGLISLNTNHVQNINMQLLIDTISETVPDVSEKEIIPISTGLLLVLLPLKNNGIYKETNNLNSLFLRISNALSLFLSASVSIVYENNARDAEELKQLYKECKDVLTLSFYGNLGLTLCSTLKPRHYMDSLYYKDFANEIHKNNNAGLEESFNRIEELIEQCKNNHVYPEIVKAFFDKTLDMLEYLNPSHSAETHEFLCEKKEAIRSALNSKELYELVTDACLAIYAPVSGLAVGDVNNIRDDIKIALDYINKNYCSKLTLEAIAENVGISTSYLSRVFKAETGQNISNYITKLKMEKAASLIKAANSETYLKEISYQVGIEDQLYFSRLFKKYFGVSPSEYKNLK